MILVTRHLLVSRVESEVNNDLKLSLLGSKSISESCKLTRRLKSGQCETVEL